MSRNRMMFALGFVVVLSMILAACNPATQAPATVPATEVVPPTEVPPTEIPARRGGWLDQIVFSVVTSDSAITQIQAGAIDTFAYALSSANFPDIQKAGLSYAPVMGTYYSIMYNPAVCTDAKLLNPFSSAKIREATNMLYDRSYVNQEIYAGGGLPKLFPILTNGPDYADLADVARKLEAKYAFNEQKAIDAIATEMTALGATKDATTGKWLFDNKPVSLIFLIRRDGDGTRKPMGDYVSDQLEKAGLTVDRQYKKSSEAGPVWQKTSVECLWNLYTGGWISPGLSRDQKSIFQEMYAPNSGQQIMPFLANTNVDPTFQKVADDLINANFTSLDQRRALMAQGLELALQDSLQVMMIDTRSFAPYQNNVQISANLSGGIETAQIAFYTARFKDQEGGTLKWGENDLFTQPVNPVSGSNWAWDQGFLSAISTGGFMNDPFTGLIWPLRAERAEVTAQTGLPVYKSLDWVTLNTADTIAVPADAWVDWDAKTQTFVPAGDGKTAKIKSVVYYPADMFDTVTWHDGSKISMADFLMAMIVWFDRAKPDSAIYDESWVPQFESFMQSFKGVKIVSTNPLTIETYTDNYVSDAELDVTSWWPAYFFSEGSWPYIAVANLGEAAGEIAYSGDKASALGIEQTNTVGGPTLPVLAKYLDQAINDKTIPYAATMGAYLTADEAVARYNNLKAFYTAHGHFVVGTGPYFVDKTYLVEKSIVLANYAAYPDRADRWDLFTEPKISVVDITGPASVKIGEAATFEISVTFKGQPYPQSDIKMVKFLLYDATGNMVKADLATFVSEGKYTVNLTADDTKLLTAGASKFEVAVVSYAVAIPTFANVQFVVAP